MNIIFILCIIFFIITAILMTICIYLVKKVTEPCMTLLTKIVLCIGSITGDYIVKHNINIFNCDIDELTEKITEYTLDNISIISNDNMVQESLSNNTNINTFVKTYITSLIKYINDTDMSDEFENICSDDEHENPDFTTVWWDGEDEEYDEY